MGKSRKLLLTFDHELFFQRAGTPERSLLAPMERLLTALRRVGAHATFFVDALYLIREESGGGEREALKRIRDQLVAAVAEGHELQLHLHSHWLDAVRTEAGWEFPSYTNYRLHALSEPEIVRLFVEAAEYLRELGRAGRSDHEVIAFRAGGLCVQPFAQLAPGLRAASVHVDSSVARGLFSSSATHTLDFRLAPDRSVYRFSDDPLVPDPDGAFIEIQITTLRRPFLDRARNAILKRLGPQGAFQHWGDGVGLSPNDAKVERQLERADRSLAYLSLEGHHPLTMLRYLRRATADPLVLLSHSKLLSPMSLVTLDYVFGEIYVEATTLSKFVRDHQLKSNEFGSGRPTA